MYPENLSDIVEEFHFNGYITGNVMDPVLTTKFNDRLLSLYQSRVSGFDFHETSPGQFDITRNIWEYDDVFLHVLTKTGLLLLLRRLTGQNLVISDVRVRKVAGNKSLIFGYQPPHRDSYAMGKKWIGPKLPGYKLIFYPRLTSSSSRKLKIYPGTHRKMPRIRNGMLSGLIRSFIDYSHIVNSSESGFCFFNGNVLHNPQKERRGDVGLRLIYVFRDERSLGDHQNLNDIFAIDSVLPESKVSIRAPMLSIDANQIIF
jgi:hypothetical protein